MARHDDKQERWQALTEQIVAAEAGLQPHFDATPAPSPEALARIRARVRSEAVYSASASRLRRHLKAGAIAAAILLAAGLGLYLEAPRTTPPAGTPGDPAVSPQALRDADGFDAFTASLSKVLSDDNPALGELLDELQELEYEHRSNG